MNPNDFTPKNAINFLCEACDFKCCKASDFARHTRTGKHIKRMNPNDFTPKNAHSINADKYNCVCGKTYKHQSSLCNHRKTCSGQSDTDTEPESVIENSFVTESTEQPFDFSIMFELIKQNQEFKELIIEQNEKMFEQNKQIFDLAGKVGNTNNTQNIKNQNNNHFNIQMFLNDKCKDAISLDDFVESLQINTKTAEYAGKHGFVNGITNIFMTGLKQLDVHMRPIHCTDVKRETIYVKGIDIWAKDDETNPTMLDAINDVSKKNMKQLPLWIKENPECQHSGTDKFEEQLRIMSGMLDGHSNKEKVLKKLAKEVYIDKNQ
jgi:hypothetical protein